LNVPAVRTFFENYHFAKSSLPDMAASKRPCLKRETRFTMRRLESFSKRLMTKTITRSELASKVPANEELCYSGVLSILSGGTYESTPPAPDELERPKLRELLNMASSTGLSNFNQAGLELVWNMFLLSRYNKGGLAIRFTDQSQLDALAAVARAYVKGRQLELTVLMLMGGSHMQELPAPKGKPAPSPKPGSEVPHDICIRWADPRGGFARELARKNFKHPQIWLPGAVHERALFQMRWKIGKA
jgi:hypothetical protein